MGLISSLKSNLQISTNFRKHHQQKMPKQITEFKDFLLKARRNDAKKVTIYKSKNGVTKFKVRCSRFLYTLSVANEEKAKKLTTTLPPSLNKVEVGRQGK